MTGRTGYLKLFEIRGVQLRVHWSFPVGGILVAAFVRADPEKWWHFVVAYTLLILIHEAAHVVVAVLLRLKVFAIEISGIGGLCLLERPRNTRQSVLVYSAGLLAQAALFFMTLAYVRAFDPPASGFANAVIFTFTFVNVVIFLINLIPQRDARSGLATDGSVLWRLFLHEFRGHPHPHPPLVAAPADQAPVFPPETRLLGKPGFLPPGFVHGIEILNDSSTPMEFVVTMLTTHLGLTRDQAIVKMLDIHNSGGLLVALPTAQEAQAVADAISADARTAGHSLVCRFATRG
jgi:ATP-dependent Clp protease adapter protein ClpS